MKGGWREMEVAHATEFGTNAFRYLVSRDGALTPLQSSVYDMSFEFMALGVGLAVALSLRWVALRARRRLPPPLPSAR